MNAFGTSYRGTTFSERMADAPCRQSDPDLSFPKGSGKLSVQHAQAKADCARCPLALREECLEIAMRTEGNASGALRDDVFGGLDPEPGVSGPALAAQASTLRPGLRSPRSGTPRSGTGTPRGTARPPAPRGTGATASRRADRA